MNSPSSEPELSFRARVTPQGSGGELHARARGRLGVIAVTLVLVAFSHDGDRLAVAIAGELGLGLSSSRPSSPARPARSPRSPRSPASTCCSRPCSDIGYPGSRSLRWSSSAAVTPRSPASESASASSAADRRCSWSSSCSPPSPGPPRAHRRRPAARGPGPRPSSPMNRRPRVDLYITPPARLRPRRPPPPSARHTRRTGAAAPACPTQRRCTKGTRT